MADARGTIELEVGQRRAAVPLIDSKAIMN